MDNKLLNITKKTPSKNDTIAKGKTLSLKPLSS